MSDRSVLRYTVVVDPQGADGHEWWRATVTQHSEDGDKSAQSVDEDPQRAIEKAWYFLDPLWKLR